MSRVNDKSYNSFLRPRWFRIELNWPTQLRWRGMRKFPLSYHDEGITERKCPYAFFCKPNQLSNEGPHVICTLKLHEFDVDALEKRNLCVAPSPRKDVPKKLPNRCLPSSHLITFHPFSILITPLWLYLHTYASHPIPQLLWFPNTIFTHSFATKKRSISLHLALQL